MIKLLAPNGKPSNLTPEQYKLVRSSAFKKWFGDWQNDPANASKVVDENGEPLVVYHGTKDRFSIFDLDKVGTKTDTGMWGNGFYFSSNKKYAETYSNKPFDYKTGKILPKKGIILDVFLSLKNPYIIKNNNDIPKIIIPNQTIDDLINSDKKYSEKFRETLIDNGYDGVFVKFDFDFRGSRDSEFVAFEPNQIKLADGTNTTFDGNNPDIRFDGGGGVDYSDFKTSVIGLVKDNKVLILKRGSTANWMPNKWSLVGGVVDSGEEPKEAIIRECFEEIGLKPINVSFNHKIMTNDSGEIYYFNGELESENVKLDYENSTFKFIAKDEINNYDFVPYIKEFIIDIFSKKINNNNITFNSGGELNKGLFAQIWGWFGIKF